MLSWNQRFDPVFSNAFHTFTSYSSTIILILHSTYDMVSEGASTPEVSDQNAVHISISPNSAAGHTSLILLDSITRFIGLGYSLDSQGSMPGRGKRFLSTPKHQDQLWAPSSPLSNGYHGLFPQE
jgi:hypothetical protein